MTITLDRPTLTYEEKLEALLAKYGDQPVRIFEEYAKFKAATEGRRLSL